MTQDEVNAAEYGKPSNWRGGWLGLYFSRRDDRAFVLKRHAGLGVTINFAHLPGVLFLAGIFVFAGVIVWLTRGTHR